MPKPVWREVFLEIALRAIRKVHLNYTPWQLKKDNVSVNDLDKLNNSKGIFVALETNVAAEISNEFIYSSYTNGMPIRAEGEPGEEVETEPKYFEIFREVTFKHMTDIFSNSNLEDNSQKENDVDLITRRYSRGGNDITYAPSLIELKRYYQYAFRIHEGSVDRAGTNVTGIIRDIKNLKKIREYQETVTNTGEIQIRNCYEDKHNFLYILTWGESQPLDNIKTLLCDSLIDGETPLINEQNIYLKWLPLLLDNTNNGTPPAITTWLWVALIEIDPPPVRQA